MSKHSLSTISAAPVCIKGYLKVRLYVHSKRYIFSTGIKLKTSLSDKSGRSLSPYLSPQELQAYEDLRSRVVGITLDLIKETGGVDRHKILSRLDPTVNSLVEDYRTFTQRKLDSGEITYDTARVSFNRLLVHLKEFDPKDYNKQIHLEFLAFLRKKGLSDTTIGIYFKRLKHFFNNYYSNFDTSYIKVFETRKAIHYLSQEELLRFHDLPKSRHRDLFLCMCYLGCRFSDTPKITKDHMVNGMIPYIQQKTSKEALAPINSFVLSILDEYDGKLPKMSMQELNRKLKVMAKEAGVTRLITIFRWEGGKRKEQKIPLNQIITSSIARKTFVTLGIEKGIPTAILMKLSGHRKLDIVMRHYLGEMTDGVQDAVNKLNQSFEDPNLTRSSEDKNKKP